MRTSTCLLPKLSVLALLAFALQIPLASSLQAQDSGEVVPASYQSGGFFNQQLGTALRFNYHTQGYGTQDDVVSLGGMKVFNMDGATAFIDGQGTLSDDFGGGFNLGVGYRELATIGANFDPQRIFGVGFWTDGQSTSADNFFTQLGFSLESLGESYDLRLNGHFPLERNKTGDPVLTNVGNTSFAGNNLFSQTEILTTDTAHNVVDGEFAKRISDLEAWAFIGGYQLGGGGVDATGYRIGVRGYAVPDLALSLQVTDDDVYATNVMFGLTWFIGRTHKGNGPCGTILDRFRQPVLRNDFIATTQSTATRAGGNAETLLNTTDLVNIVHIDSTAGAGGDGTFENPFENVSDAGIAGNSAEGDIILVHGGSTFNGTEGQIALQTNQRMLGEGTDQDGNTITHFVATNNGNLALPETADGAMAMDRPLIEAMGIAGSVITLADGTAVDNFTINGATTAISANGITVPAGDTISNVVINNPTDTGISLTDVMGLAVVNENVIINGAAGTGLLVDGGDETVTMEGAINDSTGNSLVVRNRTGGLVQFTETSSIDDDATVVGNTSMGVMIGDTDMTMANVDATVSFDGASTLDIHVDAATDIGFEVLNNTNTTVLVTAATDITGSGDAQGVQYSGNDATSSMSFADLNATAVDGDTVNIAGEGTVTISSADATRLIANRGAGDAVMVDGDATVTVNSAVENRLDAGVVTGRAVVVQSRTANDATFAGAITDEGEGLLIGDYDAIGMVPGVNANTGGRMIFTGPIVAATTTNNGVTVSNANTDAETSFGGGLDITTTSGTGFFVDGAGTLLATSTDTTPNTVVTGTGTGVSIANTTIDTAGVTFDSVNITNATGNGINLDTLDGDGQVVIGDATGAAENGGVMTTQGTAIRVNNALNVAVNNVRVANETAAGAGVEVLGQVTDSTATFTNMEVNTNSLIAGTNAVTIGDGAAGSNEDGTITFETLTAATSLGGAGDGVVVNNLDTSTASININNAAIDATGNGRGFAATGGGTITMGGTNTIDSATGTAFEVTNVEDLTASNVTIANTTAQGVVVTGQDSATDSVTLTNFDVTTTTADAVSINNNTDGTVNVNTLTAETTDGDTVVLDTNTGATVNINGMTAEATGSGIGFSATNGGTLSAAGTNNVTTNTGTGVVINDMTIAAGGATFTTVDVTNGANGVTLSENTGGAIIVSGGTMTTTGTAVSVTNTDNAAINGVTINNTAGAGIVANNSAGDALSLSNVDVTTTTGAGVDVDGGTLTATGTNTLTTTTGTGVDITNATIGGAGANFDSVTVTGATNGVILTDLSGGQVRVGAAVASGTDGAGGTLDTTGAAILVSGVTNAEFNDVTTITDAGSNGISVTHTTAAGSRVLFDNLTHTASGAGDAVVVTDDGTGELDFTLQNSNVTVTGAGVGFDLITNANAGEIDIRLNNNDIIAATGSAVRADITAGTGDVQFLVNGGNNLSNSSATDATASLLVNTGRVLNATIGDQDGTAPFDENVFNNTNGAGTAFEMTSNNAAAIVSLDLRGNTATGGGVDFELTETLGTFGIVDLTETVTNFSNNSGTVGLGGGIEADFDDLVPPIKQVD